jgi:hypothetical protein
LFHPPLGGETTPYSLIQQGVTLVWQKGVVLFCFNSFVFSRKKGFVIDLGAGL